MKLSFKRVAIINRGEPAMRLIHAVEEFNLENQTDLRTIAFYTEPDKNAMFVREADETYCLGPATFWDPEAEERKISYLNYAQLEKGLIESKADAAWAGWGFVAEHPEFPDLCKRLGVTFIGPDGNLMRKLGDKIASKRLAEEAGVPVTPWSKGAVNSTEEALEHAARIGYPLMVKATAGGGGRGIRKVENDDELASAFDTARKEALKAFGNGTVFLERCLTDVRHIEVQIIGDHFGTVWGVGLRDCTLQRRNQKVLEESPSPVLTLEQDQEIREAAARLGKVAGYHNAGTVEFLYDIASGKYFFMEVNARLQVEHPVTEATTGLDLVKLQLLVASGAKLEGSVPNSKGCAIEVRLNAEDPTNHFTPAPGKIIRFKYPTGPGIRIDTGVAEGDEIPAEFDSMIAKIIAFGKDRQEAMAHLKRALIHTTVVIDGGMSNKGFLLEMLDREEIIRSTFNTGWLDQLVRKGQHLSQAHAEVALIQAAIEAYLSELEIEKAQFFTSARKGRPEVKEESGMKISLKYEGEKYDFVVFRMGMERFLVFAGGIALSLKAEAMGGTEWRILIGNKHYRTFSVSNGHTFLIEVNGMPHRITRYEGGILRAPSPSVISGIAVQEGEQVKAGDPLVVLEAMKMENTLTAAFDGIVKEVMIRNHMQVDTGEPLLLLEPLGDQQVETAAGRLDYTSMKEEISQAGGEQWEEQMESLACLMRGFDSSPQHLKTLLGEQKKLYDSLEPLNEKLWEKEDRLLNIFADLISLFRPEPSFFSGEADDRHSSKEYLFDYLLDIKAGREVLPPTFEAKLLRALEHYGLTDLDPGKKLEMGLFRMFKSIKRMPSQLGVITQILNRRLSLAREFAYLKNGEFRTILERLMAETHGRYSLVYDLASEVRYEYFDQPLLHKVKAAAYEKVAQQLDVLDNQPDEKTRKALVQSLFEFPHALTGILSNRFPEASPNLKNDLLEIMTRRFYRLRDLDDLTIAHSGTAEVLTATYAFLDHKLWLAAAHVEAGKFSEVASEMTRFVVRAPLEREVLIDLYLSLAKQPDSVESLRDQLLEQLQALKFSRPVHRIVVTASSAGTLIGMQGVHIFTFRQQEDGTFFEDEVYRGLHPVTGKRLEMWRLKNFSLQPLPSVEDVYVFKATARDNPRDERLFAFAEVRDMQLAGGSYATGRRFPYLEMMLFEAASQIRKNLTQLPMRQRPFWNRIFLYIWPIVDFREEDFRELSHTLRPVMEGLGLEKITFRARISRSGQEAPEEVIIKIDFPTEQELTLEMMPVSIEPIQSLSVYEQRVVSLRRRGLVYPYELIKMVCPGSSLNSEFPQGEFIEHDLDENDDLVPVDRPMGQNQSNIVVGLIRNFTDKYPEGMTRVALLGDPSRGMGNLAEPECRRIMAGLDLAEKMGVPLEWYAVSAGAKISMESGTENMDWIALVLRRIINFTQMGGEINVIVTGVNVGAQPYWNAEATMLMHTKGILVMTPDVSMVLTGKQSLDYSGGVSAETNEGIGGYERIMGPNGQAQYFAPNVRESCKILYHYYNHSYKPAGERFPRRAFTQDPLNRDVRPYPHGGEFKEVGEIFSEHSNPDRKKPFDIRRVMAAVVDQDLQPLERWQGMKDAEIAVVWDAHLGGYPICMVGVESHPIKRLGYIPADGPDTWTGGTLFPMASKKIARAINAASGNRPLIVMANLSGFDGSPESLRQWQLEYGAEIGRAVVNFRGPVILCVVSRYHGGAFVVFSNKLNDNMEVIAIEGAYASVIGGAPAAAVVFAREVGKRTKSDPEIKTLESQMATAKGAEAGKLKTEWNDRYASLYAEKLGEVAEEFDGIHNIQRAQEVGSVDHIIPPDQMRPFLIETLERGMQKELERQ